MPRRGKSGLAARRLEAQVRLKTSLAVFLLSLSLMVQADDCLSHPEGQEVLSVEWIAQYASVTTLGGKGSWIKMPHFKFGKVLKCLPNEKIDVLWTHLSTGYRALKESKVDQGREVAKGGLWFRVMRAQGFSTGDRVSAFLSDYGFDDDFSIGKVNKLFVNKEIERSEGYRTIALLEMNLLNGKRDNSFRAFTANQLERLGQKTQVKLKSLSQYEYADQSHPIRNKHD
jgi:hypothetical protein